MKEQEVVKYFYKFKSDTKSLGRPQNRGGCSYEDFKYEQLKHIEEVFSKKYGKDKVSDIKVLDVGPGAAAYQALLDKFLNIKNIDCVEIYEPNVKYYEYEKYYSNVYNCDILDFEFTPGTEKEKYDLIIMGDILEHIKLEDAKALIKKLLTKCYCLLIQVPYNYPQGPEYGNKWEEHLQPDLNPSNFLERYPDLNLLVNNNKCGVYSNIVMENNED